MPLIPALFAMLPQAELPVRLAVRVRDLGTTKLWIFASNTQFEVEDGSPAGWSPTGRYLATVRPNGKLAVVDAGPRPPKVLELPPSCEKLVGWDVNRMLVLGKEGLLAWTPGDENPALLIPGASLAAVMGERRMVTFLKDKDGLVASDLNGEGVRKLFPGLQPTEMSWSPDSRRLALAVDRALYIWKPGDAKPVKVEANVSSVSWSSGGRFLLAKRAGAWSLYDRTERRWQSMGAAANPCWLRSRRLLAVDDGALQMVDFSPTNLVMQPIALPINGQVLEASGFDGLRLEEEGDPFEAAAMPAKGESRVQGFVQQFDPSEQTLTVRVAKEVDETGQLGVYAYPKEMVFKVDSADPRNFRARADSEVVAYVRDGTVTRLMLEEETTTGTRPDRPARTNLDYDGVTHDVVVVPMTFPVLGKVSWSDSFLASRGGGTRRHHGQDLMAPKMKPLVAAFDGVVTLKKASSGNAGNMITLEGDNGFTAMYMHVNNDTPGTDDARGSDKFAFAPGLRSGDRVVEGQFLGWVGDSGNAEDTGSHCHFELMDAVAGGILNAAPSLRAAAVIKDAVYPDPAPEIAAEPGETRWDGIVTEVTADGRITLALTGWGMKGALKPVTESKTLTYVWTEPYHLRSNTQALVGSDRLKAGCAVTIVGMQVPGAEPKVRAAYFDIR